VAWYGSGGRGGRTLVPPSFPAACQVACSDKGLVWIFGGTPRRFFFFFGAGFPLKSIPDLKGLVWNLGGTPRHFFFLILAGVPLNIHTRPEGPGMEFRGTPPRHFFFKFWFGVPLWGIPMPFLSMNFYVYCRQCNSRG